MKNKNKTFSLVMYSIFLVLCLTIVGITASYAFVSNSTSNNTNNFGSYTASSSIECITLTHTETGVINLSNQYPLTDNQGETSTPVVVKVQNSCTNAVTFDLAFTSLTKTGATYIPDNKIKINVQGATNIATKYVSALPALSSGNAYTYLTNDLKTRTTVKDYTARSSYYIVKTGSVAANATNTYNIRIWIDYNEGGGTGANNSTQGQSYAAAISTIVA